MVTALKPRRTRVHHRPLPDAPRFELVPEADSYSRVRYRGQLRRGAVASEMRDAQDVTAAMQALNRAHELLVQAHGARGNAIEYRALIAEARAQAGLAERFANNVAEARPSWER